MGIPTTAYVTYLVMARSDPELTKHTKFVDNLRRRVPKQKAIIVQEELETKQVRESFCQEFIYLGSLLIYLDMDEHVALEERQLRSPDV